MSEQPSSSPELAESLCLLCLEAGSAGPSVNWRCAARPWAQAAGLQGKGLVVSQGWTRARSSWNLVPWHVSLLPGAVALCRVTSVKVNLRFQAPVSAESQVSGAFAHCEEGGEEAAGGSCSWGDLTVFLGSNQVPSSRPQGARPTASRPLS